MGAARAIIYLALTALVVAFVVLIPAPSQFLTVTRFSGNGRLYTACDHSSAGIAWHIRESPMPDLTGSAGQLIVTGSAAALRGNYSSDGESCSG